MIEPMDIVVGTGLGVLGAVFGSFAGAQVWRLRAHQLAVDKTLDGPVDKKEYALLKKLIGKKQRQDRSVCLQCGHQLAWSDLIPIVSWLRLKGKCRYCRKHIGSFELIMELGMALLFILSAILWPYGFATPLAVGLFITWLILIILLVILVAYDIRWQLLPDVINFSFIGLSLLFAGMRYIGAQYGPAQVTSTLIGIGLLAGLYALLYVVSKGAWIGFGDVKLCIGLALILGDWRLAFLALFLANLIGCLLVLPGLAAKKLSSKSRIAFGPLLIAGTLIAFWWGTPFVQWLLVDSRFFI